MSSSFLRRFHMTAVMSALALVLMASRCSDDDESATSGDEAEPALEPQPVEPDAQPAPDEGGDGVFGSDAVEPDPGLGVDGIELDGPIAPQEGDGSTPDEPSFEPSEPESEPDPEDF